MPIVSPYQKPGVKPKMVVIPAEYEVEYWAGEGGSFEADGIVWITVTACAPFFHVSPMTIESRIDESVRHRWGRDRVGRRSMFYAFKDLKRVCHDVLTTDESEGTSFKTTDGETWVTLTRAPTLMDVSAPTIKSQIDDTVRWQELRDLAGCSRRFYALSDLKRVCVDFLALKDKAQSKGTLVMDGEIWVVQKTAGEKLGVDPGAIATLRRNNPSIRTHKARNTYGRRMSFYALSDLKKAQDAVRSIPKAEENGAFVADGVEWMTVNSFVRKRHHGRIDGRKVATRIDATVPSRPGRLVKDAIATFYPVPDLERVCADLLAKKGIHPSKEV